MTTTEQPVAIVTGAGSGIGRETARLLASPEGGGHAVVLVGRRLETLEETASVMPEGAAALCVRADVGDASDARMMVEAAVERFGRLDALINNAGAAPLLGIDVTTPEVIDHVFAVNALGPAYAIHFAWPRFVAQKRGVVVNVSTIGTQDPFPGFFAYASSKACVNLMARSVANEGREHGVRGFAVAPGAVETPMLREIFPESAIPPEACLPPVDVARVIVECVLGKRDNENGGVIVVKR